MARMKLGRLGGEMGSQANHSVTSDSVNKQLIAAGDTAEVAAAGRGVV